MIITKDPHLEPQLAGFKSCKCHIIYGSTNATTQTNYPVKITISPGMSGVEVAGVVNLPFVQNNLSDLAFVNQWGVRLKHWVEYPTYWTDGKLDVWVKIPSLSQNQVYPLYIFTGHPNAGINLKGVDYPYYNSSTVSQEMVFPYADHFEGSVINSVKFYSDAGATISKSVVTVAATTTVQVNLRGNFTYSNAYSCRMYVKTAHYVVSTWREMYGWVDATSVLTAVRYPSNTSATYGLKDNFNSFRALFGTPYTADTWHVGEVSRTQDSGVTRYTHNDILSNSITGTQTTTAFRPGVSTYGSGASASIDWFVMRPYINPEPTHGVTWTVW
jgi:hypothetical protein